MDISLIRKIEAAYRQKQFSARARAQMQKKAMLEQHPTLAALEHEKRAIACNFEPDKEKKASLLAEADKKIEAYLQANGLKRPEPQYDCPLCQDSGYVDGVRCACFERRLIEEAAGERYEAPEDTFENFNEAVFSPAVHDSMVQIRDYCAAYAARLPEVKRPNLILTGQTGTGKTYLLSCVANRLRQRGMGILFFSAGRLFEMLRDYAFNRIGDIDALLNAEVLLIDDLGTEPMFNNITQEYLFYLFNERLRTQRPLCISTNLSADEVKGRYGERIASRLFDQSAGTVLALPGTDLRMNKKS